MKGCKAKESWVVLSLSKASEESSVRQMKSVRS
jgi:hypothetical protein